MPTADLRLDFPNRIVVQTNFNERELIKLIPGSRYDGEGKFWHVPQTWVACLQLRGVFRESLVIGPELLTWARNQRFLVDTVIELRERTEPKERRDLRLYAFQEAGIDFINEAEATLLGDVMGLGKTIQVLTSLKDDDLPALVICPNTVKHNWIDEAAKWLPSATPYLIQGSVLQRRKQLTLAKSDPTALVIVNIEGVRGHSRLAPYGSIHLKRCIKCAPKLGDPKLTDTRCEVHPKEFNEFGFKTVVFDEAHRMKDPKALQTRAAWAVAHDSSVKRRIALTGTPLANDPSDLWSIMHFLAPLSFPTKSKFIDRYCLQSWNAYGGLSVVGVLPENRMEFDSIVNPFFRRMTKELVGLQLPPKIRRIVPVDMGAKQAKAYRELSEGLITRLDTGELLIAPTNLAAHTRLIQLASSYCELDELGAVKLCEPSPKLDALEELIDELGGRQAAVCGVSRQLIEMASKRLTKSGVRHGLITGKIDQWDRKKALKDLNDGRIQVLLFTIQAGGTGLNMTAADTLIYLQRSGSMVDNCQSEDRVHRIGSERHETVQIIDIVTRDTVEPMIMARYVEKLQRLDEITRDRERLRALGLGTTDLDELENLIMNSNLGVPS